MSRYLGRVYEVFSGLEGRRRRRRGDTGRSRQYDRCRSWSLEKGREKKEKMQRAVKAARDEDGLIHNPSRA